MTKINPMGHRVLSHTADTGIEATAGSVADLLHDLAEGMFRLMAGVEPSDAERWIEMRVESPTVEDLVVDLLSELLYRSEVEDLIFCVFGLEMEPDGLGVAMEAGGVPVSSVEQIGPAIKAVTYHDLVVEKRDGQWFARVYFDV